MSVLVFNFSFWVPHFVVWCFLENVVDLRVFLMLFIPAWVMLVLHVVTVLNVDIVSITNIVNTKRRIMSKLYFLLFNHFWLLLNFLFHFWMDLTLFFHKSRISFVLWVCNSITDIINFKISPSINSILIFIHAFILVNTRSTIFRSISNISNGKEIVFLCFEDVDMILSVSLGDDSTLLISHCNYFSLNIRCGFHSSRLLRSNKCILGCSKSTCGSHYFLDIINNTLSEYFYMK